MVKRLDTLERISAIAIIAVAPKPPTNPGKKRGKSHQIKGNIVIVIIKIKSNVKQ